MRLPGSCWRGAKSVAWCWDEHSTAFPRMLYEPWILGGAGPRSRRPGVQHRRGAGIGFAFPGVRCGQWSKGPVGSQHERRHCAFRYGRATYRGAVLRKRKSNDACGRAFWKPGRVCVDVISKSFRGQRIQLCSSTRTATRLVRHFSLLLERTAVHSACHHHRERFEFVPVPTQLGGGLARSTSGRRDIRQSTRSHSGRRRRNYLLLAGQLVCGI